MVRHAFPLTASLLAMLTGCAVGADYPSLAPRPIEGVSLAEPAARAAPAPTAAPLADGRYAAIVARARDGDAAFRRAVAEAAPVLRDGRNAAVGSDAWGTAQTRLSRLQSLRAPVIAALTDLQAESETPATQADRGLADAAARAIDTVRAIDADEARALAEVTPAAS
jgi:hypothetical protein